MEIMGKIEIEAIRDKASGCYMVYKDRQWHTVKYNGDWCAQPANLIGTKDNPDIFECPIYAYNAIVDDDEMKQRMIENGDYTEESWAALSDEQKDEALDNYMIAMEMDSAEIAERGIECLLLTFQIEKDGTIVSVSIK